MALKNPRSKISARSSDPVAVRRLLRLDEVAEMLGISVRSVWRLLASQQLSKVTIGRSARVPIEAVDALIARGGTK